MLHKLFGAQKLEPVSHGHVPPAPAPAPAGPEARLSALMIIHAGGIVERYYMAVPATRIMQKNPSCILARPDVFRKPRNALVRPEEILLPGQKFFLVPQRTVRKLWRRQPVTGDSTEMISQIKTRFPSNETDVSFSSTSTARKTRGQNRTSTKHVRFFGIDAKQYWRSGPDSVSIKNGGYAEVNSKKKIQSIQPGAVKKRAGKKSGTWQPSLTAIREIHGSDE